MADPTGRADLERWRELARKERKGADPEGLVWQTPEGIAGEAALHARPTSRGSISSTAFPATSRSCAAPAPPCTPSQPWTIRQYAGFSTAEESNAFYRANLAAGTDGPVGRLRSRHPPRLRLGPPTRRRRRRQGRRGDRLGRGHEDPLRRRPARQDVGVDDDERRRAAGAGQLHRRRRGAGRAARQAHRDHPERHPEGVHGPQHLHLPADALDADRGRHHRVHLEGDAEASTRSRSPATTCRRPGRRATSSWRSPSPTGSTTCARRSRRASTSTPSPGGCRSSSPSA